jgi:hypothetical protein
MTIAQIHYSLEQGLQNLGSFVYANYLPQEINLQFDRIVDKFIDAHLKPQPIPQELKGIDEVQLQLDNLRFIKVTDAALVTNGADTEKRGYTLPDNYRNLIQDSSQISWCGSTRWVANRLQGDEEFKQNVQENPFLKSTTLSPLSRVVTIPNLTNGYDTILLVYNPNVTGCKIDYYRKPIRLYDIIAAGGNMNYDFIDFPRHCIDLLIDLLRNRLLENIQGDRLPSAVQESNNFGLM